MTTRLSEACSGVESGLRAGGLGDGFRDGGGSGPAVGCVMVTDTGDVWASLADRQAPTMSTLADRCRVHR